MNDTNKNTNMKSHIEMHSEFVRFVGNMQTLHNAHASQVSSSVLHRLNAPTLGLKNPEGAAAYPAAQAV